jgi:integral membrane protein (TIGR01906 family)
MREMMIPNWLIKIVQVGVAVALVPVLILGNVQLLMHERFVLYEYDKPDFPPDTMVPVGGYPLSKAERTHLAQKAIASIIGLRGMQVLEEAQLQETGEPAFNAREIRHMRDVRVVFQQARIVFFIALFILVGGILFLVRYGKDRYTVSQPLLVIVVIALGIAAVAGIYVLLNFASFFTQFHHVFFEGDTWLFRRDDTLIRLFPTVFWSDAAILITGLTVVELLLVGGMAWAWGRKERHWRPAEVSNA